MWSHHPEGTAMPTPTRVIAVLALTAGTALTAAAPASAQPVASASAPGAAAAAARPCVDVPIFSIPVPVVGSTLNGLCKLA